MSACPPKKNVALKSQFSHKLTSVGNSISRGSIAIQHPFQILYRVIGGFTNIEIMAIGIKHYVALALGIDLAGSHNIISTLIPASVAESKARQSRLNFGGGHEQIP
jgi:hypothetical protein